MKTSASVACTSFPCSDVVRDRYSVPSVDIQPRKVRIIMISEAAAPDPADDYYSKGGLFERTTVQAFRDAGAGVDSIRDILSLGIYLTTAVKCGKTDYGIRTETVRECSLLLEREMGLFPEAKILMLMGDVAIKSLNAVAKRLGEPRVIPAGATYKLRGAAYAFRGMRVFPSYLQAGPSFFIEKSKRTMIAEDIAGALALIKT